MDTNVLKRFAQEARQSLRQSIKTKLALVLAEDSLARRESQRAVRQLETQLRTNGEDRVVEQVAYIWFNRFTALQFMDMNDHNRVRVIAATEGKTRPEILADASAGVFDQAIIPENTSNMVRALLDGRSPSHDPENEAYRLLLVATCNHWHGAMPFMFERIADFTELLMPDDLLSSTSILAELRKVMTVDTCADVEVIGWLYQFYISEKKDEVFEGLRENKKVTPENIPAATQLFTPHWIVKYLVQNSLGRLWMLNRPHSALAGQREYYIAPQEPEEDFLKIASPEEIRICDPAVGSGHMLTYAFDLLYAIYEEAGYEAAEIPSLILQKNLYGIELDPRAGALAAFALTMKARGRHRRFFTRQIAPNICVLENVSFETEELRDYVEAMGRDLFTAPLRATLTQFEEADNFGSLIQPELQDVETVRRHLEAQDISGNLLLKSTHDRVMTVLRMADYLSPKYHVVVANPPYMGSKGMNGRLSVFAKDHFPDSKADLFAMFMERTLAMTFRKGVMAMINMQSWMFLSSFEKLRVKLLANSTLLSMAHLGERGFDSIGGAVVSTTAFAIENFNRPNYDGDFLRLVDGNTESGKADMAKQAKLNADCGWFYRISANNFGKIPGSPIAYWLSEPLRSAFQKTNPLGDYCDFRIGMATGKNEWHVRQWFEVNHEKSKYSASSREDAQTSNRKWFPYAKGGEFRKWAGNEESLVNWENDGFLLQNTKHPTSDRIWAHNFNLSNIFKPAICWTVITTGSNGFRLHEQGFIFDAAAGLCQPKKSIDIIYLLGLLNSKITEIILPILNPTINLHPGYLSSLPGLSVYELQQVKDLHSLAKSDWDAFETSWDFTSLPLLSRDDGDGSLSATFTALRADWRSMIDEMQRLEEENNRIFIDAYGLQDELTPEVPRHKITLTCNPAYRYGSKVAPEDAEDRLLADTIKELISYAVGCMFGRYALEKPGLILANAGETLEDYLRQVPEPGFPADDDNVIPVLDGSWFEDDIVSRFRRFLRVTFGDTHFEDNLRYIEAAIGRPLRDYFIKDFYKDHVQRYKKRPIYWQFSSPKGGFNALIYMHRYNRDTVSTILNRYLRDYKSKLEAERTAQQRIEISATASQREKTQALKEVTSISARLNELEAWERDVIFPLAAQRIELDLDDGVKANYPKFGKALKPIMGLS